MTGAEAALWALLGVWTVGMLSVIQIALYRRVFG